MKKFLALLVISIFTLQSCSVNSEIVFHKDAVSTTFIDVDMKDAIQMMKSMTPDSVKNNLGDLEKLPTTWTSYYDLEKKEGKLITKNPDTVKIMKKIFMKSNIQNKEFTGVSVKMDRFTKTDYKAMQNLSKEDPIPVDQNVLNDWNGKTLVIDTENFNLTSLKQLLGKRDLNGMSGEPLSGENMEKASDILKMMLSDVGTTLKFDKKIKSITGKHNWLTKVDDYSVRINYDLDVLFGKNKKLNNGDEKIIIVTE